MVSFPQHHQTTLQGHGGPVHCVKFSAGAGQYILTGCSDRTVRLFNPLKAAAAAANTSSGTGQPPGLLQTYSAHGYAVLDLAISNDNARFASVGGDRQVFLWDVGSGRTLRRWAGHGARVNAVAFGGPEDGVVVSGSLDASVRVWDARSASAKPVQVLDEAGDSVSDVSVRGAEVVAGSVDGRVRRYDLRMGELLVDCVGAPVTSVRVSADGESVLVGSLDARVRLMDARDGKVLRDFSGHVNGDFRVRSCFGMGGEVVVSGSEDGKVFAWDVVSGEVVARLDDVHGGKVVSCVDWNGSKQQWASAGTDGTVSVWTREPTT